MSEKPVNPLFKGAKNSKLSSRGVNLEAGEYLLKIVSIETIKARKSGDAYLAHYEVVETTNPAHPVGSKRRWYQALQDADVAFANLKRFTYAVLGFDASTKEGRAKGESEVDPEFEEILTASEAEGLFNGKLVRCKVEQIKTREKGFDFNMHTFSPA